ncbi:hypothetical protein C8R48DRAFT_751645 [Suillus tomentosus]|nr:hypothetical protein C8R48DRAFT_751645 [Suillus tomentosus]
MPCSPISPTVGITTEALDLYRVAHLRSPHLSIQAFVKTVCDLHGVEFHRHLSRQFSIVFDSYLQIRRSVAAIIAESLQRNSPDWQLKHTCPTCTYELTDEEALTFRLLYSMDGNDSLKRVLRRSLDHDTDDSLVPSSEVPTGQQFTSDRCRESCLSWLVVLWVESLSRILKVWGIYNETGIFMAVCCHRFVLLVADMVQSGELAKYPLAVIAKLLDVFRKQLGSGYDIGCQFKTTLKNSSLGPLARSLQHTCLVLVPAFSLTMYIKGLGLEDLETCERTFSKSNSLASALCYVSVFHWQQAIDCYFEHNNDFEVYANLSNFLYCNYKQALDILNDGNTTLPKLMQDLRLTDKSIFECWLEEEKTYLQGLTREPEDETLQMEYWQKLVNFTASKEALKAAMEAFQVYSHHEAVSYDVHMRDTRKAETARCHAVEDHKRNSKLTPEDSDWQRVGRLVAHRKYQHALDHLKGLIVACIFELMRMNQAATGEFAMHPPRKTLKWDEVVEYVFLADFDLLCDMHADVSQWPWASPVACRAMDLYFKMCRAREEIQHLNMEVWRLVTYIRDEDKYLRACEDQLKAVSPTLAHQVAIH